MSGCVALGLGRYPVDEIGGLQTLLRDASVRGVCVWLLVNDDVSLLEHQIETTGLGGAAVCL